MKDLGIRERMLVCRILCPVNQIVVCYGKVLHFVQDDIRYVMEEISRGLFKSLIQLTNSHKTFPIHPQKKDQKQNSIVG